MNKKVVCPQCKEDVLIKDDKKYIDCPYCHAEFSLKKEEEVIENKDRNQALDAWNKMFGDK